MRFPLAREGQNKHILAMSELLHIIRKKIAAEGPITVAEYMALALGHPEHGYYQKRDPLGLKGDFITSPEISQIFGEMLGVALADLWQRMGSEPISLAELGPGRGTLMADLLRATKNMRGFHESITIHMIETSPVLAHQQYLKLRDAHPRIEWLESVEELPENKIFFVANEFFDALPIRQYVMTEEGICERRIYWNDARQTLDYALAQPSLALAKSGSKIPLGTVMEQCPAARSVMRQISRRIAAHGGAAILIDYGYLGEAHHDTLQAVKAHQFHPVLKDPGEADLTAHVDFTSLAAIAKESGLAIYEPVPQGLYLTRLGAKLRAEMLQRNASDAQRAAIAAGLERLISPQAMGDLFKVLAVTSAPASGMPGFE
jgi:NADH dehydrogenase [ubiquinone] 1 alpha subcomplex assembly factor 7